MRPPEDIVGLVESLLDAPVKSIVLVGGGCIANASRLNTEKDSFFLKWASGPAGETFEAERLGLRALAAKPTSLTIPEAVGAKNARPGANGFLLMEWIEEGVKGASFWEHLGAGLAELHRAGTATAYGLDHDNFIGRLPQENGSCSDWIEFFADRRILPQVERARNAGRWTTGWNAGLEGLLRSLPSLLPASPYPSLVHGDLWSGNVLATKDGGSAIIDPAVYHGHREVDLAMTELFGRFPSGFYSAYDATWMLDAGYQERRDVYNLYHLINHLNHFGSSYASQVAGILGRFK